MEVIKLKGSTRPTCNKLCASRHDRHMCDPQARPSTSFLDNASTCRGEIYQVSIIPACGTKFRGMYAYPYFRKVEGSCHAKNQFDSSSRFDTTGLWRTDRQDRHTTTANTALAASRGKNQSHWQSFIHSYSFIANCQTAVVDKNKTKRMSKIYKSQYIFRYNILTVKLQSVIREMRSVSCLLWGLFLRL